MSGWGEIEASADEQEEESVAALVAHDAADLRVAHPIRVTVALRVANTIASCQRVSHNLLQSLTTAVASPPEMVVAVTKTRQTILAAIYTCVLGLAQNWDVPRSPADPSCAMNRIFKHDLTGGHQVQTLVAAEKTHSASRKYISAARHLTSSALVCLSRGEMLATMAATVADMRGRGGVFITFYVFLRYDETPLRLRVSDMLAIESVRAGRQSDTAMDNTY